MINIKVPSLNRQDSVGGGSTFIQNLKKFEKLGYKLVDSGDYDIFFIAGASLADRGEVERAEEENKPIVLRIDNILEDSKNRNTGMPRLREFAEKSEVIVYQTEWAKKLMKPYCGNQEGAVINNGVDTDIFYPKNNTNENIKVFYSKFSRNEVKRFHEVQYFWREYNLEKKGDELILVGRFADDVRKINNPFEFHNGEKFNYKGILQPEAMAEVIRSCNVAFIPYFADACSNTILEIQACGVPVLYNAYGGTKELVMNGREIDWNKSAVKMVEEVLEKDYLDFENFKLSFGLETMCQKYYGLFKILLNE